MRAVDATITAAWISAGVGALSVGGVAITAWIGSRNTRLATEQTVAAGTASTVATLAAAREDRLWEKRAAAYEETMAELHHRKSKRFEGTFDGSEQELNDIFGSSDSRERYERQGRLAAYASDSVRDASSAAMEADWEVVQCRAEVTRCQNQVNGAETSGRQPRSVHETRVAESMAKLNVALKATITADQRLIEVIRHELRSKPEAVILPVPAPVRHPGFWHRR